MVCGGGRGRPLPVGAACRQAAAPSGVAARYPAGVHRAVRRRALAGSPQPIRLILDDVQDLVDPQALDSLRTFIRVKPATVRLVLASRFDPPLSLPRLRLAGRLWELRAAQLSFTPPQAAALLENSGLRLSPQQVEVLHRRTGGWAAGLRLAALGMAESADHETFLTQFSGDDRSVADYLVGEILGGLPADLQDFLRVTSICDPMPAALAAELSGRDDAGSVLDRLEHRTSLVTATGPRREVYRIQELLRTHLVADLQRHGVRRVAGLHAVTARWWAAQDQPLPALEHATRSGDEALLIDLLHRFALRLLLAGDHGPLRRALAGVGAQTAAADPWLFLACALTHLAAGERAAAQDDLRHAQQLWPAHAGVDLAVLRAVAEQFGAGPTGPTAFAIADTDQLPVEPELEALARLSRGHTHLAHDDRAGARAEWEAALALSRRHGFDYLTMQCLTLLGVVAGLCGELRTMRTVSDRGPDHRSRPRLAGLAVVGGPPRRCRATPTCCGTCPPTPNAAPPTPSPRYRPRHRPRPPHRHRRGSRLHAVHGAALFDLGDRADGLAELQQARSDFGDNQTSPQHCAAMAMLEFRVALLLGHAAAARTVLGWLTERTGDNAELVAMRAWTEAAAGRHERARTLIRPVLDGSTPALLPHTVVEGWLLETSIAAAADERPAARHALQTALALAEPLDALRPFIQAGPHVRELLIHQRGSFGAAEQFANQRARHRCRLTSGRRRC